MRWPWSKFLEPAIHALETFLQGGAEEVPGPWRWVWASLRQHRNAHLHPNRIGPRGALSWPLPHQPVTSRTAAKLCRRSAAAAHTDRRGIVFTTVLNIQDANVPRPPMQGVANVQKLCIFSIIRGNS